MTPSTPVCAPPPLPRRPSLAGIWAGLVFIVLTIPALLLVLLVPNKRVRSSIAHRTARIYLRLAGIKLEVQNPELLPKGACVVVCNHASYLDGVIVKAALPSHFSFVIKKEILKVPLVGLFLRLIGSEFVDRFNHHSGAMDTRRLLRAAAKGQSFGFFPEGTIHSEYGIAQFHTGAFVIAARVKLPVVPIAIRGARHALPLGTLWLKPGRVTLSVQPQIFPSGEKTAATQLRNHARQSIVAAVQEPDLTERPAPERVEGQHLAAS